MGKNTWSDPEIGIDTVRIISGLAKGKRLATFSGRDIRPTPDRVREAVFSILRARLGSFEGRTVLDLFAGSGAMSLEALSRGASRAWMIDSGDQSARIVPTNLKSCSMEAQGIFIRAAVKAALPRLHHEQPFDLVFLDPPYGKGLVPEVVTLISELHLLAPDGVLCAETAIEDEVPETLGQLVSIDFRRYGSTAVHFFAHSNSEIL